MAFAEDETAANKNIINILRRNCLYALNFAIYYHTGAMLFFRKSDCKVSIFLIINVRKNHEKGAEVTPTPTPLSFYEQIFIRR